MRTSALYLDVSVAIVVGVAHEEALLENARRQDRGEREEPHGANVAARVLGRFVGEVAWMQFNNAGTLRP